MIMVEASSRRNEISNPEILTQTGSPKGALKLNLTTVPGKKPISKSFTERGSSVKPEITADSPGFMDDTDFAMKDTLFRSSLNNGEYSRSSIILKIVFPCAVSKLD
jgi:hypothetical protein